MPQASMVLPDRVDPKDLKERKVLKEIRVLLDLKAIRALKDPRAMLVNQSQPPLLCHSASGVHGGKRNWYSITAV